MTPLAAEVEKIFGPRGFLHKPEDLALYEYDGGIDKARPDLVVFPQSRDEVAAVVKLARKHGAPIVGRGAGTGLSGGAIPRAGGIVVSFARMNRILEIDLANERAVVEPGVVNIDISNAVDADGYFYAPDPSSQRACTIGGNVSENSGGPHTLAYGVTTNHVLGLEAVLPDGSIIETGCGYDHAGYDLTGLLVGSEGTMVLVTKIIVRLMRKPEMVKTILAIYESPEDAGDTVAKITARAITPVAVEMLDGPLLRMVEDSVGAGYPRDAAAVLLIELEGLKEAVEEQIAEIHQVCLECNAREFRVARSAEERELLWKGRKNAFGAVGRFSAAYYVQDGVVPRTQIAPTLRFIDQLGKRHNIAISNIFHAGDGNLHPLLMFDPRKPGEREKIIRASDEILEFCISVGGSITGEHGVGMEKMEMMEQQFPPDSLEFIARFKKLFDPECRLNPGKVLPTGRGCLEIRQRPGQML
ncbi:MAG TPA: FAD-linked oxidase C-terminal domain-containing protein [Bryobacteraceae bacterium]|jgi:glycolate oxidase|nr:FAD-linked oxidase C-terminal domain-containing protein [Bryobacteraceae bacterium]